MRNHSMMKGLALRGCIVAVLGLCGPTGAEAHDFWLQPDEYWLQPDVETFMTLQVGHGPSRQRSPIAMSRITRFGAIAPNGAMVDLRDNLRLGGPESDGKLRFRETGTYVLILQTDSRAQSHLPAVRFNDYLRVEGLTPAMEQRERTHRIDMEGSEIYSRVSKSILQVGPHGAESDAMVTEPVGLPLEIVPERSPYATPRPATLPVLVLYEGNPLQGALVKLTNLAHDSEPLETHLTDSSGRATFPLPEQGKWLLNVIWTKALPSSANTDFETVFSSLTFGYAPAH